MTALVSGIGFLGACSSMTFPLSSIPIEGPATSFEDDAAVASAEYVIGVPDLLEVTVWEHPDFSGPLLVRRDGKVSIALIGDVHAAGRTPRQLAADIQSRLSEYITAPRVDIAVTDMRSQVASVIGGGIVRSGIVPLQHNTRVIDALAAMGGLTPFAKKRRIRILRNTPDGQIEYPFDYTAFINGNAPTTNILLKPGDTIIVPE
jgi:polysaccharide export outer membrane protein